MLTVSPDCDLAGRHAPGTSPRGFSLVELLVVVGVIVLLISLLVLALARAMESKRAAVTLATMNGFMNACEVFMLEQGEPPGLIPDSIVAFNNHQIAHDGEGLAISSTESAMLHLMGGYALESEMESSMWHSLHPQDGWVEHAFTMPVGDPLLVKLNRNRMGDGPTIDRKPYAPYWRPGSHEVSDVDADGFGQWPFSTKGGGDGGASSALRLPDLVDGWGRPIIYLRQTRKYGPLVGDAHQYVLNQPQFYIDPIWPYTRALSQQWGDPCFGGIGSGSILYYEYPKGGGQDTAAAPKALAALLRSPTTKVNDPTDPAMPGVARGAMVLISAGADGIYFSAMDGPGSPARPIGCNGCGDHAAFAYEEFLNMGSEVFKQFDDILMTGGSLP